MHFASYNQQVHKASQTRAICLSAMPTLSNELFGTDRVSALTRQVGYMIETFSQTQR